MIKAGRLHLLCLLLGSSLAWAQSSITSDTLWTASEGPYHFDSDLTIATGVTLTIEPGTIVTFGPDVQMIVEGCLHAEGSEESLIHFTRPNDSTEPWGGIQFKDTQADNDMSYCLLEYGETTDGQIGTDNSKLHLDHVTFDHSGLRRIRTQNSNLLVEHCVFVTMFGPDEAPLTDNSSEHIWGAGVPSDGYFIIRNNVFGKVKGHNDAIDFDGPSRPNPIPQFLNNIFLGGGDDALDLESDAHIEGNLIMNFVKDEYNNASGESNVISAGNGRDYVMVRNIFKNVEHVAQVKDEAFLTFVNNTVVNASAPVIYFDLDLPGRGPGRGAIIEGCIFDNAPNVLEGVIEETELIINQSIFDEQWHGYGTGNYDANALLIALDQNDFSLHPDSIAIGTGPCGLDMGALVPQGAAIYGDPNGLTCQNQLSLTIGGPGIVAYQYALNDPNGPWSDTIDVNQPLELTDLVEGQSYTVFVKGQDTAAQWQEAPTMSSTWAVDLTHTSLQINEVLACNVQAAEHEGTYPDIIELIYQGASPLDLSGMSITDDPTEPDKSIFPIGLTMQPGEHLVLLADGGAATSGFHLDFSLSSNGEGIYLYDASGTLLDSIEFGPQVADLSIGRYGPEGQWRLTQPTIGSDNVPAVLGRPQDVVLNEWLAQGDILVSEDYIELYNTASAPVRLTGLSLTADPLGVTRSPAFGPLSFMDATGHLLLEADGQTESGHVNFTLLRYGGYLGLLDGDLAVIDEITYDEQTRDVSEGRTPDGGSTITTQPLPTPGAPNPGPGETVTSDIVLLDEAANKTAWIPSDANMFATDWKSNPNFDDSQWLVGQGAPGGVGYENGSGYENLLSIDLIAMRGDVTSCYVRCPFDVTTEQLSQLTDLRLLIRYDDGFVAYLNGVEVARENFTGDPAWNSDSDSNHEANAGDFDLTLDLTEHLDELVIGRNLLAFHGLNVSLTSSDYLISAQIEGSLSETLSGNDYTNEKALLNGLRITELMYHDAMNADLDYIELTNISNGPLDVNGVRFTEGIDFTFAALTLEAGQAVVLSANPALLQAVYGSDFLVVGPYDGKLSNGGEELAIMLPAPLEVTIQRFEYDDAWYPSTDGQGQSLTIMDAQRDLESWNETTAWTAADPSPGL